jgi:hypothetical protein
VVPLVAPVIPIIQQFCPLIDLIQKFRLSESTIDSTYSINSVDVIINGGNMGLPQVPQYGAHMPVSQQQGQFVWVPQVPYVKPSGGNGGNDARPPRVYKYSKGNNGSAPNGGGRFSSSRGGKFDKRGPSDDKGGRNSRGDQSSRADKDSSGRIEILGGTPSLPSQKGAIKNVIVLIRRLMLIKQPV